MPEMWWFREVLCTRKYPIYLPTCLILWPAYPGGVGEVMKVQKIC